MSAASIRAIIALDSTVDRAVVQAALPETDQIEFVGALEVYEGSHSMLEDTRADIVLVAYEEGSDGVPAFIEGAVRQDPSRPVIALITGTPNGSVRRTFEAGADDIVALDGTGDLEQVVFAMEKAVARRTGAAATNRGRLGAMISVVGPKGGSGKTVAACNVACALAADGARVALLDLDLQFGDVGLAMGLTPTTTLFDLAKSGGAIDSGKLSAYLTEHPTGVRTLLAPTRPEQASAVSGDLLRNLYTVLRSVSDYVVVDTPPRFNRDVLDAIETSTDVLMVGMLDALSLKTTKLGLEALERMSYSRDRVRLLLNRADSRVGITPGDVAAIVGRQPDVLVPSHRDIAVSLNEGTPIVASQPRSDAAKAFKALAEAYATARTADGAGGGNGRRGLRLRKAKA